MGTFQNQLDFDTDDTDLPKEIRQFAQLDDKHNYAKELAQLLNFLHHHWNTDAPDSDYEDRSDELSTEKINGVDLAAEQAGQFLQTQSDQDLGVVSDQEIVDIINDEINDDGGSSISTLQEQVNENDSDIDNHDTRITNNSNDIGTVDGSTSLQQQIDNFTEELKEIDIESSGNEAIGIPKYNEGELSASEKSSLAQQAGDDRAALVMIDGTVGHLTQ